LIVQKTFLYYNIGNGGGKIKYKIIVPVLVLFSLALFINVSDVSATNSTDPQLTTSSPQSKAIPVNPKVTFTKTQINYASANVKKYVETNNKLPSYVTISNTKVTMPQFMMLMTDNLAAIKKGSSNPIVLKTVKCPTSPSQSIKSGTLTKTEFLSIANKIDVSINANGKAPSYIWTSLGKMRFESMVYTYSKILNFCKTNNRLPNTVSVNPWSTSKTSEGSPSTVSQILKTAAKYGYSSAAHDAAGLISHGSGDCWAMSDYLFKKFKAAKIKSRIVQYATEYSSNHRSVQLYKNGTWVDVPYRGYGFNSMFNNTSGSKYGSVIAIC
jgi:Pseudomurein-binding repeat